MINRVAFAGDNQLDLLLVQKSDNIPTPIRFICMYSPNLRREILGKSDPPKSMRIVLPRFCRCSCYNFSGREDETR